MYYKDVFMFSNNLTQTYSQQDATLEILVMLAGAFLLGSLLSWLIMKLRDSEDVSLQNHAQSLANNKYTPQTTGSPRIVGTPTNKPESTYRTPRVDDLTKISGINSDVQAVLKKEGINSFIDLRDIKSQTLKLIQDKKLPNTSNKRQIETWPHQASLAAKGEWNKLEEYQSFIVRAQSASKNVIGTKSEQSDDLKIIEGIGPKIEEILNKQGITTFNQLSNTDSITLKKHIIEADERFQKNETDSWPHQAAMADKEQWDELSIYQEFMHSDTEIVTSTDSAKEEEISHLNDHDDLKKIEGIGPKIEEVLNSSGIYTYRQLHNSNKNRLKNLLENAGNQFRVHDPESWPHQAGMADRGEWKELSIYQEFMANGQDHKSTGSVSLHVKTVPETSSNIINKKDDLKKIEGVGPKIEELLMNSGITNYKELANSSRDMLKQLLDNAGPQYRMHEPESWPEQAKLAFEGKWEKLEEYKDMLISGRK